LNDDPRTGQDLKRRRLAIGVSQTDLARTLGITVGAVSRIETRNSRLRSATVAKYLPALLTALAERTRRRQAFAEHQRSRRLASLARQLQEVASQ
jgi:transcriptional regulator with XRE-family HTH domain